MTDTPRATWESLTEDERAVMVKAAVNHGVDEGFDDKPTCERLRDLDLFERRDDDSGWSWYSLTWRGFRIIPPEVATEIDREVMHE